MTHRSNRLRPRVSRVSAGAACRPFIPLFGSVLLFGISPAGASQPHAFVSAFGWGFEVIGRRDGGECGFFS